MDPTPAQSAWVVDVTPPETLITGGSDSGSVSRSTRVTFTFVARDNLPGAIGFEIRI